MAVAAALFGLYYVLFSFAWWPPISVERGKQRAIVAERIQAAGGWAALREDCDKLVEQHKDRVFQWRRWRSDTKELPAAIAMLNAQSVEFWPIASRDQDTGPKRTPIYTPTLPLIPEDDAEYKPRTPPVVVHIKIFGLHRSGGRSTPYFGLEVISGPDTLGYRPHPAPAASGNGWSGYRKVSERVFEVY